MRRMLTLLVLFFGIQHQAMLHPLNLTVTDIHYSGNKMHITMRLFADDLQASLSQFSKGPVDLINVPIRENLPLIQRYIQSGFSVSIEGIPLKLSFQKASVTSEVLIIEYEAIIKKKLALPSVKIKDSLLFADVPEQKNLVNFHQDGKLTVLTFVNGSGSTEKKLVSE